MNGSDRRDAWRRYWASGALHSLAGSFPGNYQGAIRAHWAEYFAALDAGDRVLDLGSGNGALPLMILEMLPRERWPAIEAVDLAEPRPAWLGRWPDAPVRFQGGVRMERLPHRDRSFTLLCSQFALEYAEREAAAGECARVLAERGRLVAVMHHAASLLADVAREECSHLEWLLRQSALEPALLAALPHAAGLVGSGSAPARERLNQALAALARRIEQARVADLLIAAGRAALAAVDAARRAGVEAAVAGWMNFRTELDAALFRARELLGHALDEAGMALWREGLERAGLTVERLEALAEPDRGILGWALCARRAT